MGANIQHPIFEKYDVAVIARRMGYSELTIMYYREGYKPLTATFRKRAALAFRKPEEELFLPEEKP